jgi:hypothetical protein
LYYTREISGIFLPYFQSVRLPGVANAIAFLIENGTLAKASTGVKLLGTPICVKTKCWYYKRRAPRLQRGALLY